MGGSLAFASPSRHIAFAHVCNQMDLSATEINPRSSRFYEAIENILKKEKMTS